MRSNHEYDYFGNVIEYEYDYLAFWTKEQMTLRYGIKSMCLVTEALVVAKSNIEYVSCYRGLGGGQE